MGQIVTQNLPAELLAAVTNTDGTPATLLTFASVQVQFRKQGDPSFNNKVLSTANFVEIGQGFYKIVFDAGELNIPGPFAFVVFGAGLQNSVNEAQIRAQASTLPSIPVSMPTCTIVGNINDMSGDPIVGVAISARLIGMPTIEGAVGLTDDSVTVTTDDSGVFAITMIRLAVVEFFIPRLNYRRQLTVPNAATVNLFTGIP